MTIINHRITIINVRKPRYKNINEELQWFGNALGLFGMRDKDKSCFRLFIELLKLSRKQQQSSSDELAERLGLTRGTVVHHLNKLMESGIVVHEHNHYMLRVDSLKQLVDEVEKDIQRSISDMRMVAEDIDKWLGFESNH